mmetsp:Transcript_98698/g.159085  ORF Transcript_98698/g.159085 Transcript_98698/m.159085 type:complete len:481 (+) Transcript_98698:48-1490(+)
MRAGVRIERCRQVSETRRLSESRKTKDPSFLPPSSPTSTIAPSFSSSCLSRAVSFVVPCVLAGVQQPYLQALPCRARPATSYDVLSCCSGRSLADLANVLVSFFLSSIDGIGVEFSSGDGSWRRPAARIQHIQVLRRKHRVLRTPSTTLEADVEHFAVLHAIVREITHHAESDLSAAFAQKLALDLIQRHAESRDAVNLEQIVTNFECTTEVSRLARYKARHLAGTDGTACRKGHGGLLQTHAHTACIGERIITLQLHGCVVALIAHRIVLFLVLALELTNLVDVFNFLLGEEIFQVLDLFHASSDLGSSLEFRLRHTRILGLERRNEIFKIANPGFLPKNFLLECRHAGKLVFEVRHTHAERFRFACLYSQLRLHCQQLLIELVAARCHVQHGLLQASLLLLHLEYFRLLRLYYEILRLVSVLKLCLVGHKRFNLALGHTELRQASLFLLMRGQHLCLVGKQSSTYFSFVRQSTLEVSI